MKASSSSQPQSQPHPSNTTQSSSSSSPIIIKLEVTNSSSSTNSNTSTSTNAMTLKLTQFPLTFHEFTEIVKKNVSNTTNDNDNDDSNNNVCFEIHVQHQTSSDFGLLNDKGYLKIVKEGVTRLRIQVTLNPDIAGGEILRIQYKVFSHLIYKDGKGCGSDDVYTITLPNNNFVKIKQNINSNTTADTNTTKKNTTSEDDNLDGKTANNIWDCSILLTSSILSTPKAYSLAQKSNKNTCIELGSGTGLLSIALSKYSTLLNSDYVLATDLEYCLDLLNTNFHLNDCADDSYTVKALDWSDDSVDSKQLGLPLGPSHIFSSDCIWLTHLITSHMETLYRLSNFETTIVIAYQRRGLDSHTLFTGELDRLFEGVEEVSWWDGWFDSAGEGDRVRDVFKVFKFKKRKTANLPQTHHHRHQDHLHPLHQDIPPSKVLANSTLYSHNLALTSLKNGADSRPMNVLQLICFDFDLTLSVTHLYHVIQSYRHCKNTEEFLEVYDVLYSGGERCFDVYGGKARVSMLHLMLGKLSNNADLYIVTMSKPGLVSKSLQDVGLLKYFKGITNQNPKPMIVTCLGNTRFERRLRCDQCLLIDDTVKNFMTGYQCDNDDNKDDEEEEEVLFYKPIAGYTPNSANGKYAEHKLTFSAHGDCKCMVVNGKSGQGATVKQLEVILSHTRTRSQANLT